jgi:Xaa-Pro aminopeptidase
MRRSSKDFENHIAIIPAATKLYMTHDIPYPFRQNTDFLYLTGFIEPDSLLLLEAHRDSLPNHKATIFVQRRDPNKEIWDGARAGRDGASLLTGIPDAHNVDELDNYLQSYVSDTNNFQVWYNTKKPTNMTMHLKNIADFLASHKSKSVENITGHIQAMRAVKSPAEIELMKKSNEIASRAFIETMRYTVPDVNEAHLQAKMDFECRYQGAEFLAYPPVVAGGDRANTIHYINNNQIVCNGELVLVDAGCEYHSYASDITRTWPVSGTYSKAQRALYEVVLEVQNKCIELCANHDMSLASIYNAMQTLMAKRLQELGIMKTPCSSDNEMLRFAREFCPHHVGHYLGIDVHDTDEISRDQKLTPGMVLTVEPGLYIPRKRRDVHDEFKGIGIRIEDNVLITECGFSNLSQACPKNPDEIEKIVKSS